MAAYSEMLPATGAQENEEKKRGGRFEEDHDDTLSTCGLLADCWWHTQRLIDPAGTLVKAAFFPPGDVTADPYAVHIVLTPKISTTRPFL